MQVMPSAVTLAASAVPPRTAAPVTPKSSFARSRLWNFSMVAPACADALVQSHIGIAPELAPAFPITNCMTGDIHLAMTRCRREHHRAGGTRERPDPQSRTGPLPSHLRNAAKAAFAKEAPHAQRQFS